MGLIPLAIPPGVWRQGTAYQAKGRAYDANLVRWYGSSIGPIKGWRNRGSTTVTGKARCVVSWRAGEARWSAVGTHQKLYAISSSASYFDITPTDFVAGDASASLKTGFGYGTFGSGTFGTPRADTGDYIPATVWDLDNIGSYLVGCAESDGRLLLWQLNTGTDAAAVTNAPTSCNGVFVSNELAMVALGAGGNPRKVQWSDLVNYTVWSPLSTNKAGDVELATPGAIMGGRRMPYNALIWTDLDVWTMTYIGDNEVYQFKKVGEDCGALSRGCMTTIGQQAVWWGQQGFMTFDGSVRPLRCDVQDYVLGRLNIAQRSKITCFHNPERNEIWWFYPSNSGTENDSYVYWDYKFDHWNIGTLSRLCAVEPGIFVYPIAFDGDGQGYEHEVGSSYAGASPYVRTGPIELGNGDRVMRATALIQDEGTEGLETVGFYTRQYPNGDETTVATVSLDSSGKTDIRFTARQAEMLVTFAANNAARWGAPRLELAEGGRR
jgi:hypothetical protein